MFEKGSSSSTRRINSTGMSAEPVTATRKRREVVLRALRMVEDRLVERRRPRQDGDALRRDAGQHPVDVEDGLGQHGGTAGDAGQDAGLEAEHVEVRIHLQVDVAGAEAGHGDPVRGHHQRAAVRHDDALRNARRPRGEEDVGGIVRAQRGAASLDLGPCGRGRSRRGSPATTTPHPRHAPLATTIVRSCGQRGAGVLEHGDIVGPQEVGHGDEDAGTAAGEDDGRLGALEARVDGHQDGAGGEQAERRHRPFGTVAAPDGHPVARLDPDGDERGTELPGRLGQLGVGEASSTRRARPPGRRTASAAPPTMAGMEGQGGDGRRGAHRRTGAGPASVFENGPLSIQ